MNTVNMDRSILNFLRSFPVDRLTRKDFDRKCAQLTDSENIMGAIGMARSRFLTEPDWPQAMSAIIRNEPDQREMILTLLPNQDTIAALLAIRLGINMHLAVALAYDDVIHAAEIENGCFPPEYDATAFTGLATFARPGEAASAMVLMVRKDVRNFALRFAPEELVIFDQHPDVGLHQPFRTAYFKDHSVACFAYRTDEKIALRSLTASTLSENSALIAMFEKLRNTKYVPDASSDQAKMKREMHQKVQGITDKHLGVGMCHVVVQLPTRVRTH